MHFRKIFKLLSLGTTPTDGQSKALRKIIFSKIYSTICGHIITDYSVDYMYCKVCNYCKVDIMLYFINKNIYLHLRKVHIKDLSYCLFKELCKLPTMYYISFIDLFNVHNLKSFYKSKRVLTNFKFDTKMQLYHITFIL